MAEERDHVILGIHTNMKTNWGPLFDGHAWISVHRKDRSVETYGLYPDEHPSIEAEGLSNGPGSDVRRNIDDPKGNIQRYFALNSRQVRLLDKLIARNSQWSYTNNCASWATEIIRDVTEKNIHARESLGVGSMLPETVSRRLPVIAYAHTPRALGDQLSALNRAGGWTTVGKPVHAKPEPDDSSSSLKW